jgi:NTE family protein
MNKKKTVSLVLGSGGARGYAHIGVIEVLLEEGYEIKSISGSSMGALVGAIYACGKLDVYKKWVLSLRFLDIARLLDLTFGKNGFIQGQKVFKNIENMIGSVNIEDLDIPFTAVATDLVKQKEVWIREGKLLDAVRASIAIPTIFTPKKIGNRYLVDGSVLNPIPIAPTMLDDTDMTIAVNLNARAKKGCEIDKKQNSKKLNGNFYTRIEEKLEHLMLKKKKDEFSKLGIFGVMIRSVDTMQKVITEYKIAGYSPNVLINIPCNTCEFYEFDKAKEMIQLGRDLTQVYLKKL